MYESSTKSSTTNILPQDGVPVKSSIPSVARCRVQDESPSPLATLPTLGDEGFASPWRSSLFGEGRKAIRPTWSPPCCGTARGWVIRHHRARPEGKRPKGEDAPASARPGVRWAQPWLPLVVLARCVGDPCQNPLIALIQEGWESVIAATPDVDLLLAVDAGSFRFVQPL